MRLDSVEELIGEEPHPLRKKPGSGLMLYLYEVDQGFKTQNALAQARQTLEEQDVRARDKWRTRVTSIATVATLLFGSIYFVEHVRAWFWPQPPIVVPAASVIPH